ncbi:FAD/NAD(P)-binding domain-containing protein [Corynespora cassiicola Philippines]|uniref:FAD/NAD(P)-binding domain-containing protein n=1 Tax=Corynespora cassiicola Philippines TaxID=1448308 RepID=A0A2T2NJ51_CORCC|nr:FAD/NAD(P)-binding domain-containing protein [Corynespora cassiicola Philippines]
MSDSEFDFDIAIIGAGIGGLGLAIGLTHLSIPFTIYESAPAFSAVGAGVGLGPNALRAMDLIDPRFRDMYMAIATGNLKPEKKHVMMEAMLMEDGLGEGQPWWGKGEWGSPNFERTGAHRKDLLDIMTSLIDKRRVRFGKRVLDLRQHDDTVTLVFDDGETVRHAAAIGCDGVKGITRRFALGARWPDCVEPKYTGKYCYRAIVTMDQAKEIMGDLATDAKMFFARDGNFSTYPISEGTRVNVVAFKRDEKAWSKEGNAYEVTREEMMQDFEDGVDARLLSLLEYAKPTRWGLFHHPKTPTYYCSLLSLLGDVAHAGGPHQGAGAGQGLEDSLILSRVLGTLYHTSTPDTLATPSPLRTRLFEAAFQAYDEIRRPRAEKQVLTAQECGEIYNLRGEAGRPITVQEALTNLNTRFEWIWEHDLAGDAKKVDALYRELVRGLEGGSNEQSVKTS